ncbi:hypothetical protein [Desulfosarcina ovata]|uniref:Nickel transport protein n=1 Tax=Desulfosarcina ovata subsp. ovata TaxID=2752305 RepID=A0A5K8ACE1_9BACT|nr:hypothetical protein [Desulfosarcina ovata]BBO89610.1 hypothetical protein DSCOOX_27900 [Desulfosarcina ovata subsp. ovata]
MKNVFLWICWLAISLTLSSLAWGHGTIGYTQSADGVRVNAGYDDGEPMSYAAVEISAPEGDVVFQKGRTDRNGVFMFVPDQPGKWCIVVSDGMGHRLALEHQVESLNPEQKETAPVQPGKPAPVSRREGIVAGIGIIFGLFGLLYGWKIKRRNGK